MEPDQPDAGSGSPGPSDVDELTDVTRLRALTHPIRIALLEALTLYGPQTATEAAERVGESPSTCSFHLRKLAKYGFVTEAGPRQGRRRPWKVTHLSRSIREGVGPQSRVAVAAYGAVMAEHVLARYRAWRQRAAAYPRAWRDAAGETQSLMYLTPTQLEDLRAAFRKALAESYNATAQGAGPHPPDALPVELLIFGYPIGPPEAEPQADAAGPSR